MLRETAHPCSDSGTALVQRTIDTGEVPVSSGSDGSIEIAVWPDCGARCSQETSLDRLAGQRDSALAAGR